MLHEGGLQVFDPFCAEVLIYLEVEKMMVELTSDVEGIKVPYILIHSL